LGPHNLRAQFEQLIAEWLLASSAKTALFFQFSSAHPPDFTRFNDARNCNNWGAYGVGCEIRCNLRGVHV